MKHIKQRHRNTCAIATLAMLTGRAYDKVYKQVFPKRKPGQRYGGTYLHQTVKFLEKKKVAYKLVSVPRIDFRNLKTPAFISVRISEGHYHAVAWDPERKRILDPAQPKDNGVRINVKFANEHCRYYIKILNK